MILAVLVVLLVLFVVLPLAGMALWSLVSIAIVGLVAGGLGRLIVPGRQPIGLLWTFVLGMGGSLVGGAVGDSIGVGHLAMILLEIGGSALLVAIFTATRTGRAVMARNRRALP